MKHAKKLISLLLAMAMVLAMTVTTFAAGGATTGSITIKPTGTVSVKDKTFKAYKILDVKKLGTAENESYVYTVPAGMKQFYANRFDVDQDAGNFDYQITQKINALKTSASSVFEFASAALAAAKNANPKIKGVDSSADGDNAKISNLPFGYYVIEDEGTGKPISALILDTVDSEKDVYIKADKPSVDKNIVDNNKLVKNNNAAVGDKVPYKVTSTVPDMTGYKKYYFVLSDTLSKGLTFNDDVAIKVNNEDLTRVYKNGTTYYSDKKCETEIEAGTKSFYVESVSNVNGTTSVKIVFVNFVQYNTDIYKAKDIEVTYSAILNKDAVIGVAGNPNAVDLTYSNNPNTDESGNPGDEPGKDSPTGETPDSITRTYVTGIELIKVDPDMNRLAGAEFEIKGDKINIVLVREETFKEDGNGDYWKLKDGSYTTDDPNAADMDASKYESTTQKYTKTVRTTEAQTKDSVKATGTTGANGILYFDGLSAGEYEITEIKSPAGYNLLKEPIKVKISWTKPESDATTCKWNTATFENGTASAGTISADGNRVEVTVENTAGGLLPSTGGIGTTIFYVLGAILMIGAAVALILRRRVDTDK